MSIQIEVPLDSMARPNVAQALANLMLALGSQKPARTKIPTARVAKAKPVPAPKALPSTTPEARWVDYLASLPENSRKFLELLEKRGQVTVDEAVEHLGLTGPKAMGGLTGAMRRWAPKRNIQLPFQAITGARGERCWVWTGRNP